VLIFQLASYSAHGRSAILLSAKSALAPSLGGGGRAAAIPAGRETPVRGAAGRHA